VSIMAIRIPMKKIVVMILMAVVSFAPTSKSQAQTVRDDNSAQAYFEKAARVLCGPRARVSVSATSASVFLSGEYLPDRNLNEVARNLALDGLNAFPDSPSFYVYVEDSKGHGSAEVRH
jgi:hypothetical protein